MQATDTLDPTIAATNMDRGIRRYSARCFVIPMMFAATLTRRARTSVRQRDRAEAAA